MSETSKTPFTDTNGVTPMSVFLDAENAIAPLDDVIGVLRHAYHDFSLGNVKLDDYEAYYLRNNYGSLGSLIALSINTLEKINEDFYKINPKKKEEAQTQSNPESAN